MDGAVRLGEVATPDGSASFDPDGDIPLSYQWEVVSVPFDSTA